MLSTPKDYTIAQEKFVKSCLIAKLRYLHEINNVNQFNSNLIRRIEVKIDTEPLGLDPVQVLRFSNHPCAYFEGNINTNPKDDFPFEDAAKESFKKDCIEYAENFFKTESIGDIFRLKLDYLDEE